MISVHPICGGLYIFALLGIGVMRAHLQMCNVTIVLECKGRSH